MTRAMPAPSRETGDLSAVASLLGRHGGEFVACFDGRSMEPTIPSGAEVRLRCPADDRVGSIVACARGERVIVHRLVARARDGRWRLTRGDAHALPDPPLTPSDVLIGAVVKVQRGEQWIDPPAPPSSLGRRAALAICLLALRLGPRTGRAVVGTLLLARRWLFLVPRTLLARLRR